MKNAIISFFSLILLASCAAKTEQKEPSIVSMQTIDRNGFSETISSKDRLSSFSKVDFLSAQPYQKVLRVYPRDPNGQSVSRITSYHSNGQVWQYLEVSEGRAHGAYKEWHPNGRLKIEAQVIEGLADVGTTAQASWLFEGISKVWDDEGRPVAEFCYEKGSLQGECRYFHQDGSLARVIPYQHNEIDGTVMSYAPNGETLEQVPFQKGLKNGVAEGKAADASWTFWERFEQGKLLEARYTSSAWENLPDVQDGEGFQLRFDDNRLSSILEIRQGSQNGSVRMFLENGSVSNLFHIKGGLKNGEELLFFTSPKLKDPLDLPKRPKISLQWHDDAIHGITKTWYENGILESQREMNQNKKSGLTQAYYADGSLMLMEEYDHDRLLKGSYFKRGDKKPVSRVDDGIGTATLHDNEGRFKQKIHYERGQPTTDKD